jgi:hypothetical protein
MTNVRSAFTIRARPRGRPGHVTLSSSSFFSVTGGAASRRLVSSAMPLTA